MAEDVFILDSMEKRLTDHFRHVQEHHQDIKDLLGEILSMYKRSNVPLHAYPKTQTESPPLTLSKDVSVPIAYHSPVVYTFWLFKIIMCSYYP